MSSQATPCLVILAIGSQLSRWCSLFAVPTRTMTSMSLKRSWRRTDEISWRTPLYESTLKVSNQLTLVLSKFLDDKALLHTRGTQKTLLQNGKIPKIRCSASLNWSEHGIQVTGDKQHAEVSGIVADDVCHQLKPHLPWDLVNHRVEIEATKLMTVCVLFSVF